MEELRMLVRQHGGEHITVRCSLRATWSAVLHVSMMVAPVGDKRRNGVSYSKPYLGCDEIMRL